jgi:hypothetical protein
MFENTLRLYDLLPFANISATPLPKKDDFVGMDVGQSSRKIRWLRKQWQTQQKSAQQSESHGRTPDHESQKPTCRHIIAV